MSKSKYTLFTATICATVLLFSVANADAAGTASVDPSAALVRKLTGEAQQAYLARDFATAQARYKEALDQAAKTGARSQIVLLSNLGAAYREDHKYPEAEDAFKRAIALAQKGGLARDPSVIVTMQQYAHLLRKVKRTDEADAMELRASGSAGASLIVGASTSGSVSSTAPDKAAATARLNDALKQAVKHVPEYEDVSVDKLSIEEVQRAVQRKPDDKNGWIVLGYKYLKGKDYPKAIETYKTITDRFASDKTLCKAAYYNTAECQYVQGQYKDCVESCQHLIENDPEEAEGYLLMSSAYSALGDNKAKYEIDKQFVAKFPNHERHSAIEQSLDFLKRDIEDQAKASTGPTDYERRHCWVRAPMPLKVYVHQRDDDSIKFEPSKTGITAGGPFELIQVALDAWVQASQGRIQYVFTPTLEEANISCFFTSDPDGLENEFAAGVTSWDVEGKHRQCKVKVLTISRYTGKTVDRAKFLDTCLHEFGHAFGLEHSSAVEDVMYRATHPQPLAALSENDKARVIRLYTYP